MRGFAQLAEGSIVNTLTSMKAVTAALISAFLCSAAVAETSEERSACIGDAFRVCWSAIPNRHDVFVCLMENRSRLNPACRVVMDQYRRPHRVTRRSMRTTRAEQGHSQ
jgi:hypothetical protein